MKRLWISISVVAAVAVLAPLVVPWIIPWSCINCRHEDINIKTGIVRQARYLWFVQVSERFLDTPLSLILDGERVDVAGIEEWQRVNTFSPGAPNSPHYVFHDAVHQALVIDSVEPLQELSLERKRELARAILTSWQQLGNDEGADELLRAEIEKQVSGRSGSGESP